MKVKFANAEVDIWKLRRGTVLSIGDSWTSYGTIEGIRTFFEPYEGLKILFRQGRDVDEYLPRELNWLEPH